jgi:hypothetical protein
MNELRLYEIAANIEECMLQDGFDEVELSALVVSMEAKAGAVVAVSDKLDSFVEYCKSEEKRIAEKRKFAENRAKRLKKYLQDCMEASGMVELPIGTKTAKIQKTPGKLVMDCEEKIPKRFMVITQTTAADKMAIKEALKSGDVSGCHIEKGFTLKIK